MSRLKDLHKFGQSPWYDNIERDFLLSGGLKSMIDEDGIAGVTSNPSIFEKAINGSAAYDAEIAKLTREGKDVQAIYDELTTWDVSKAADILHEVYQSSKGLDGFVSIEVSPHLAHDAANTVKDAKRLAERIGKDNLMIKVPATKEGIRAIQQLTVEGINVNATLIFSQGCYSAVARAYILGITERLEKGLPVDGIHSVASFFVSRIDTYVDTILDELAANDKKKNKTEWMKTLRGKAAVAQSKVAYNLFRKLFYGPEFKKLENAGANVQRLLFGSTSTKNPAYSDVKYVEEIIGEGTINTIPHVTIEAFRDHGQAKDSLGKELEGAKDVLTSLRECGISMADVCQQIQADGVEAFIKAYDKLIASLEEKRKLIIS
ncbi:transaldolase [Candidatus Margulisiibacteriota bacterium]